MAKFPIMFSAGPGPGGAAARTNAERNLRQVWGAITTAVVFGIAVAAIHRWQAATISIMWAAGCLVVGAAIGFLFGIPRVLQGDAVIDTSVTHPAAPTDGAPADTPPADTAPPRPKYRQLVNTSLEQVSEWLTKMIIGIGLSQLNSIWNNLIGTANFISRQIDPTHGAAEAPFAMALVIYFSVSGFLSGYLLTRLFLAPAFGNVDAQ